MKADNILKSSFDKVKDAESLKSFFSVCAKYIENYPDNFETMYSFYEKVLKKDVFDDDAISLAFYVLKTAIKSCPDSDVLNVYTKLKRQIQLLNKDENKLWGYIGASSAFLSTSDRMPDLTSDVLDVILEMKHEKSYEYTQGERMSCQRIYPALAYRAATSSSEGIAQKFIDCMCMMQNKYQNCEGLDVDFRRSLEILLAKSPDRSNLIAKSANEFLSNQMHEEVINIIKNKSKYCGCGHGTQIKNDEENLVRVVCESIRNNRELKFNRASPDFKTVYASYLGGILSVEKGQVKYIDYDRSRSSGANLNDYFFPNNEYVIGFRNAVDEIDLVQNSPDASSYLSDKKIPIIDGYYVVSCLGSGYKKRVSVEEFLLSLNEEQLETLPEKNLEKLNYFDYRKILTQCHFNFCKTLFSKGVTPYGFGLPPVVLHKENVRVIADDVDKANRIMSSRYLTSEAIEKRLSSLEIDSEVLNKSSRFNNIDEGKQVVNLSYYKLDNEAKERLKHAEPFILMFLNEFLEHGVGSIPYDYLAIYGAKLSKEKQQKIGELMLEYEISEKTSRFGTDENKMNQLKRLGLEYCGKIKSSQEISNIQLNGR